MRNLLYICENQEFDPNCQIESSDVAAFFATDIREYDGTFNCKKIFTSDKKIGQ